MAYQVIKIVELNDESNKHISIIKYAILCKDDKYYLQLKLKNKSEYLISKFNISFKNGNYEIVNEFKDLNIFPNTVFMERSLIEITTDEIEDIQISAVFGKKITEVPSIHENQEVKDQQYDKDDFMMQSKGPKNKKSLIIGIVSPIVLVGIVLLLMPKCGPAPSTSNQINAETPALTSETEVDIPQTSEADIFNSHYHYSFNNDYEEYFFDLILFNNYTFDLTIEVFSQGEYSESDDDFGFYIYCRGDISSYSRNYDQCYLVLNIEEIRLYDFYCLNSGLYTYNYSYHYFINNFDMWEYEYNDFISGYEYIWENYPNQFAVTLYLDSRNFILG